MTLEAEVSKPDVKGTWFKDDNEIPSDDKYEFKTEDTVHSLTIKNVDLEDEGEYAIEVPGDSSTAMVWVEGKLPLRFLRYVHAGPATGPV